VRRRGCSTGIKIYARAREAPGACAQLHPIKQLRGRRARAGGPGARPALLRGCAISSLCAPPLCAPALSVAPTLPPSRTNSNTTRSTMKCAIQQRVAFRGRTAAAPRPAPRGPRLVAARVAAPLVDVEQHADRGFVENAGVWLGHARGARRGGGRGARGKARTTRIRALGTPRAPPGALAARGQRVYSARGPARRPGTGTLGRATFMGARRRPPGGDRRDARRGAGARSPCSRVPARSLPDGPRPPPPPRPADGSFDLSAPPPFTLTDIREVCAACCMLWGAGQQCWRQYRGLAGSRAGADRNPTPGPRQGQAGGGAADRARSRRPRRRSPPAAGTRAPCARWRTSPWTWPSCLASRPPPSPSTAGAGALHACRAPAPRPARRRPGRARPSPIRRPVRPAPPRARRFTTAPPTARRPRRPASGLCGRCTGWRRAPCSGRSSSSATTAATSRSAPAARSTTWSATLFTRRSWCPTTAGASATASTTG
jgi:hypothetical protein